MDKSEDVERLFSWIRAPMVHYREFSPQVEVAEAVATWPLVHKAAVETGVTSADDIVPQGDFLAHQRLARLHMGMPELVAKAIQDAPPPGTVAVPVANAPHVMPSSDRLVAALGQRVQAARADRAQGLPEPEPEPLVQPVPRPVPPPPSVVSAAPVDAGVSTAPALSGFDDATPALEAGPRRGMPLYEEREAPPPARERASERAAYQPPGYQQPSYQQPGYQPQDRGALFRSESRREIRGESRMIEREAPPPSAPPAATPPSAAQPATRQNTALGAVFNRLSGQRERERDRLPDPRNRSRTTPGLGGVFDRLR